MKMDKVMANFETVGKIIMVLAVCFITMMATKDIYYKTNIFKGISGVEQFCLVVSLACISSMIYYAVRTIQKEMYVFKRINRRDNSVVQQKGKNE